MDIVSLVIGLLLGWLIELSIDWYYWRRPRAEELLATENHKELVAKRTELNQVKEQLTAVTPYQQRFHDASGKIRDLETRLKENEQCQEKVHELENEITRLKKQVTDSRRYRQKMVAAEQETAHLTQKVTDLEEQITTLNESLTTAQTNLAQQVTATPQQKKELQKIEGIGPKMSEVLTNAGIISFAQLANTTIDQLKEILQASGDRYRFINPETWPEQAQLAAAGAWDELKALQSELHGGQRRTSPSSSTNEQDETGTP